MGAFPRDLVPLGLLHNERNRDLLIERVESEWRFGLGPLRLWGEKENAGFVLVSATKGFPEIIWMGGPAAGSAYYCDVSIETMRSGEIAVDECWGSIHIRRRDFNRLRRKARGSVKFRTHRWLIAQVAGQLLKAELWRIEHAAVRLERRYGPSDETKDLRVMVAKLRKAS